MRPAMESSSPPDNESPVTPNKRDRVGAAEPEPPPSSGSTRTRTSTTTKKEAIRHAEKRRKSSGRFADRIAQLSLERYHQVVPHPEGITCLSTLVAQDTSTNQLLVVALGVGTKFLTEETLQTEEQEATTTTTAVVYGGRVRDLHAEVLCRRAFRRTLTNEIRQDMLEIERTESSVMVGEIQTESSKPTFRLLERVETPASKEESEITDSTMTTKTKTTVRGPRHWRLRSNLTLHAYSSSAPCGNAVLKKFADLRDNIQFRQDLSHQEWPTDHPHPIQLGHSIAQGQFALLVKHDRSRQTTETTAACVRTNDPRRQGLLSSKQWNWPANQSTDWCPSGTTTVWSQQGSLHTCSDKLCRWNCLGWQGSLLFQFVPDPLYISTLTVGRKLSLAPCRRAVCCRACPSNAVLSWLPAPYRVQHPSILANAVYMDETAAVSVNRDKPGEDVRFHSATCWVWWLGREGFAEALDGSTGYLQPSQERDDQEHSTTSTTMTTDEPIQVSRVCTQELVQDFLDISNSMTSTTSDGNETQNQGKSTPLVPPRTLSELLHLKRLASPSHEEAKDLLHTKHAIFRQWKRRWAAVPGFA